MKLVDSIMSVRGLVLGLLIFMFGNRSAPPCWAESPSKPIPATTREFRAAWVATVANIDWPSKKGLSTSEQKRELIAILDRAVALNLNAIIFQVRPHCDALYASDLEPWSEYLTGTMGQRPEPFYDPLEYIVAEAHGRGLELHAWFNPYRALHPGSNRDLPADHVSKAQPHIVREYGKHLWLDPGEEDAIAHNVRVILDVVNRYDVDGIHFDDYFYPYQIKDDDENLVPFPDDASWQKAEAAGSKLSREDWRRRNVDRLIHRLTDEIHAAKPWVKFGISPFGIWRPGHPPQIKGFDAYASLYADAKKWWNEGWVDYLTPQLYWKIDSPGQSYPLLMQWWHEQNEHQRHLWPGNYTSRVEAPSNGNWPVDEIINQITHTRSHPGAEGNVHFSMKALMDDDRNIAKALIEGPYSKPALVPATTWLAKDQPARPVVKIDSQAEVGFTMPKGKPPWLWVIKTLQGNSWQTTILPGTADSYAIESEGDLRPERITVSAVNRTGAEGPVAKLDLNQ